MKMITGSAGFIGSHFAKQHEEYFGVEQHNAMSILERFTRWQDIDEIIHMGAISSTTETDLNKLHFYNVELTLKLFEKAIEYQILFDMLLLLLYMVRSSTELSTH